MTRQDLIDYISGNIYPNGQNQITAPMVRDSVLAVVAFMGDAATYGIGTVTDGSTGLVTGGEVYSAINAAITSAIKFAGVSSTVITDGGTETPTIHGVPYYPNTGDVVLYGGKEFLWTGIDWEQLGDESSFALKTITITGTGYLTGGGDLTENRTLDISETVKEYIDHGQTAYGWGDHSQAGYLESSVAATTYETIANANLVRSRVANLEKMFLEVEYTVGQETRKYLKLNPTYFDGFVSDGFGIFSGDANFTPGGGGGGADLGQVWQSLQNAAAPVQFSTNLKFHQDHLPATGTGLAYTTNADGLATGIGIASGYKLPNTTEWNNKADASALAAYLPLSGGTMASGARIRVASGDEEGAGYGDNYTGGILLREYKYQGTSVADNFANAPGITFYWEGRYSGKLAMYGGTQLKWNTNVLYHAGNSNNTSVDWTTNNLNVYGDIYPHGGYIFMNSGSDGIYISNNGISWHGSNNGWAADLIGFNSSGNMGVGGAASSTYKLNVSGSLNATTIYQNGVALGARAFDSTAYLPLAGGTMSSGARITASTGDPLYSADNLGGGILLREYKYQGSNAADTYANAPGISLYFDGRYSGKLCLYANDLHWITNTVWHQGNSNNTSVDWTTSNLNVYGNIYPHGGYIFMNSGSDGIYISNNGISWHGSNNGWAADLIGFNSSGNMGVGGAASSTYKLDVNGSLRSSHFYMGGYLYMQFGGSWRSIIDNDGNGPIFGYAQTLYNGVTYLCGHHVIISGSSYGNTAGINITSSNNVGVGNPNPQYKLDVSGVIYSTTGVLSDGYGIFATSATSSDERLKGNICSIGPERAWDVLKRLKPKEWTWNYKYVTPGKRGAGLVAQDVADVLDFSVVSKGKYLHLDYNVMHGFEIAGLQDVDNRLSEQEKRLRKAEKKIAILEAENEKLKMRLNN